MTDDGSHRTSLYNIIEHGLIKGCTFDQFGRFFSHFGHGLDQVSPAVWPSAGIRLGVGVGGEMFSRSHDDEAGSPSTAPTAPQARLRQTNKPPRICLLLRNTGQLGLYHSFPSRDMLLIGPLGRAGVIGRARLDP